MWADQLGDEPAELKTVVESEGSDSVGAALIRKKLLDLFDRLLGVEVDERSTEIDNAYRLFVDIWTRRREFARSMSTEFFRPLVCDFALDHRFFEGILDHTIVLQEK